MGDREVSIRDNSTRAEQQVVFMEEEEGFEDIS